MRIKKTYSTLSWIIDVMAETKWKVIILICIQIFQGVATIVKALLLGHIVNYVINGYKQKFVCALIVFICLVLLQIGFGLLYRFLNELCLSEMENKLKSHLLNVILNGDYAEVTHIHTGEWINYMTSDTSVVTTTFVNTIPESIGLCIRLFGAIITILIIKPILLIFLFAGGIALVVLTRTFRIIMKRFHKKIQEADGKLKVFLQERLSNLLIIRTFVQEKRTSILAEELMKDHKKARMNRNIFIEIFYGGYSIGINSMYILGIFFCGFAILNRTMSYGNLVVILQLLEQIQSPFANITGFLPKYYAMIASAERLIDAESINKEKNNSKMKSCLEFYNNEFCAIGFKNATFAYQKANGNDIDTVKKHSVLKDFSFEIKKGEQVVFTGPSGCGKSTVLKLLMDLYPLNSGEVYMSTKRGQKALTAEYRKLFAYVPQGNQLLNGTIRESITFNDKEEMQNEEKIKWALKIACAEEFVDTLDKGIDTMLGEKGAGLSEGQIQRIAIARAIYSEHPILLLDEATSALDIETANKMLDNLNKMTDKTVIMVTHRKGNIETFTKEVIFSKDCISVIDLKKGEALCTKI